MKHLAITTTLLMTFSGILPVSAYSGIADVNGWSTDQLQEAGITIKPWANDEGRDFPAVRWVEISYDWKKMGEDRHVEMTLYSGTKDFKAASLCRAEHRKGQTDPTKLLFAIPRENIENCYVWILFPEEDKEIDKSQMFGLGDGPQGFSLDAWRMIQLAGGVPEEKPGALGEVLPATGEETASTPEPENAKGVAKPDAKSLVFKCPVCGLAYKRCGNPHCGLGPDEHHKVNHPPTHGVDCKGSAGKNPVGK
ncbi:hypothetical protein HZ994_09900 [Akkermansiaceae bacterium]|nr:hypothetical protein HZ994_09900 [Akkermansiaceae bacterium]